MYIDDPSNDEAKLGIDVYVNQAMISSDNDLWLVRCQAIIRTSAYL